MKRIISVILMGTFAVSLLTACQPTPEVSPLQSKGQLQEKIEESEEVKVYEETLPHIKSAQEFSDGHQYEIDADIIGQDAENIPIYDVEFVPFEDGEGLKKRLEAAFEGYSFTEWAITKEYYSQMLTKYRNYLSQLQNGIHPETGEPLTEAQKAELDIPASERLHLCDLNYTIADRYSGPVIPGEEEKMFNYTIIDNLEALLEETMVKFQQAPSKDDLSASDFLFQEKDGETYVRMDAANEKETLDISVGNYSSMNDLWVENMTLRDTEPDGGYIDFPDRSSSPEEFADNEEFLKVKAIADELIADLEARDLMLTDVKAVEKKNAFILSYTKKLGSGEMKEIMPKYYYSSVMDTDIQGYIDLWGSEICQFEFHDGQLYELYWRNPMNAVKKVDNAKVLPWEEILRIAEQQLEYIVVPSEGKHEFLGPYKDIVIDRIELGYTKMLVKDTYDQYQMIPTWNFFGHNRYMNHQEICFVTVNAVDGSIMEHRLGY